MSIYRNGKVNRGAMLAAPVPSLPVRANRRVGPGYPDNASMAALASAAALEMASTDMLAGLDLSSVLRTETTIAKDGHHA